MTPSQPHFHVCGVAGVGMSAVAQVLLANGAAVSGSDRFLDQGQRLPILDQLAAAGVALQRQDGSGIKLDTAGVVISTAIEPENPDVQRADALGVQIIHRAEMLARLAEGRRVVAITGTAGKTTTTGLVGWILEQAGMDPTVVNGGVVLNWKGSDRVGNVRAGESDLWVIEADESDRSLLRFHPERAVITNVAKDHFELDEVVRLFQRFAGQVREKVICPPPVARQLDLDADVVSGSIRSEGSGWVVTCEEREFPLLLLGEHNAENAMAAIALCLRLGVAPPVVASALASFRGIERRLERVGQGRGVTVVDDYGHNPMKIAAAWRAVAGGANRVWGVWRPHGFGPLALMFDDFADAFCDVCGSEDRVCLLPVFYAGGTASGEKSSEDLAACLVARGVNAACLAEYSQWQERVVAQAEAGDVVLVMGARDPGLPAFARSLAAAL